MSRNESWAEHGATCTGTEDMPGKDFDLCPGAYELLPDNNSNHTAFEWSLIQLFTFQSFVMRTNR